MDKAAADIALERLAEKRTEILAGVLPSASPRSEIEVPNEHPHVFLGERVEKPAEIIWKVEDFADVLSALT